MASITKSPDPASASTPLLAEQRLAERHLAREHSATQHLTSQANIVESAFVHSLQSVNLTSQRFWVAYSGGLDSTVLLHLSAGQRRSGLIRQLSAIHVNHNIHADSVAWASHCQTEAAQLQVPLVQCRIPAGELAGGNLEQRARQARYQLIANELAADDLLLTAHHQRDQAETLLLQLFRGGGVRGTAAMGELSHQHGLNLLRPLLDIEPEQLLAYARHHHLRWVEDPTNHQVKHDRNYLRHQVMPVIRQRWPKVDRVVARSARLNAQSSELADDLAVIDLAAVGYFSVDSSAATLTAEPEQIPGAKTGLSCPALIALTPARLSNVLRYWLKQQGCPVLSAAQLRELCHSVLFSREDRSPQFTWGQSQVYRYQDHLYVGKKRADPGVFTERRWHLDQPLLFTQLGRQLTAQVENEGLRVRWQHDESLTVRFRRGGETIQWHGHRHKLKKLLQEWRVPPHERQWLPLVFAGQQLLAIPGYAVADSVCVEGREEGWQLNWHEISSAAVDTGGGT